MNEQVKLINDLRQLGASNQTIQQEIKRSKELEAALFNYFRRDMFKKLKRSSSKATPTSTSTIKKGEFQKTRAFSTSLYSYNETDWAKNEQAKLSTLAHVVDDQCELDSSEEKVNEICKIRSSTIPSFRLAKDQLRTLSSGDEGSITDLDESQSTSPRTPFTNTSSNKEFDFEPVAGQSHSQPVTVHSSPINHAELKSSQQSQPIASTAHLTSVEPRIDFELDVKIFFNSGQCVLHTKDQKTNDATENSFNRNFSNVDTGGGGANHNAEHTSNMSPTLSSSQIAARASINKSRSAAKLSRSYGYRSTSTQPDFTVFLIPGLDIKLYYSSKSILAQHEPENEQAHFRNPNCNTDSGKRAPSTTNGSTTTRPDTSSATSLQRLKVTKKASLFAWITLSSIPDEICISPHILDFFEEALKPIPITVSSASNSANATMSSADSKRNQELLGLVGDKGADGKAAETPAAPQYVYYASFPVDVIVFFHFQPTIIQLCCLPVSRVECLLHLPSIDLVMSSKGSDFELDHNLDSPQSLQQLSAKTYKNLTKSVSIYACYT